MALRQVWHFQESLFVRDAVTNGQSGSFAAWIQAGIGNVAAGSVFATLTSAAMAGYGAPIVLGGVWSVSSLVCWGSVAWKKWTKDSSRTHNTERGNSHTEGEGTVETTHRNCDGLHILQAKEDQERTL